MWEQVPLAACAVADQLEIPRATIISALEAMPLAERWRMQLTNRTDGISVINDAYNASPDSTKAALQTLAQRYEWPEQKALPMAIHHAVDARAPMP